MYMYIYKHVYIAFSHNISQFVIILHITGLVLSFSDGLSLTGLRDTGLNGSFTAQYQPVPAPGPAAPLSPVSQRLGTSDTIGWDSAIMCTSDCESLVKRH